jgi:Tol biopolymer transport system component
VWFASDGYRIAQLRQMPVGPAGSDAKQARDLVHLDALGGFDLLSDGSLVFEQSRSYSDVYQYQDLFRWDRRTGEVTQLTRMRRARDPAVSPDERQVAYSQNLTSTSVLAVMPLAPDPSDGLDGQPSRAEVVWRGGRFDQAYQPAWSPDGKTLAFSAWRQGGYRDILLVDVATRRVTEVTHDRALDGSPVFSPDGRWLFFDSDRTGISNLYAYDLHATGGGGGGGEPRLWQITDEVGGAYEPTVSPDGTRLAYRGNVAEGYDLYELTIRTATESESGSATGSGTATESGSGTGSGSESESATESGSGSGSESESGSGTESGSATGSGSATESGSATGSESATGSGSESESRSAFAAVPSSWRPAVPYLDDRPPPTTINDDEVRVSAPRPYRPLESLAPAAWTYEALASAKGSYTLFRTSGIDTASQHSYSLSAGLILPRGELNLSGSYAYFGLRPGLRFSAARAIAERTGYRIDNKGQPYRDEILSATASVSLPGQRKPGSSWFLSFDYAVDWTRLVEKPDDSPDPNDVTPRVPLTDYHQSGLGVRLSYSSLDATLHGVGPQAGMDLSLSTRVDLPELGATYRALTISYSLRGFAQLPAWTNVTRPFGGEPFRPSVAARLVGAVRTGDLVRTGSFGLGGFPEQDLVSAVLDRTRAASTGILRGYPARTVFGNQYHLFNSEARQALWNVERGLSTLPIYVQRLHVAALWDAAAAWDVEPTVDSLRTSLGGALRLDLVFGYFVSGTLELGFARGLTKGGVSDGWLLLTGTL